MILDQRFGVWHEASGFLGSSWGYQKSINIEQPQTSGVIENTNKQGRWQVPMTHMDMPETGNAKGNIGVIMRYLFDDFM